VPAVAEETDVPLPFIMPLTLVDTVIAGVVVGVATEPPKPLALLTDTLVTVPEPPPPVPFAAAVTRPLASTVMFAFV
jgi:hypothetical protein